MKDILCYLSANKKFEGAIGNANVRIELFEGLVVVTCNSHIHTFKIGNVNNANYATQDILEKYKIEGDGDWYCCEECFEGAMNRDYGEGKWRATNKEGAYGGFYEYLNDGDEWEDTGIFWTEWN